MLPDDDLEYLHSKLLISSIKNNKTNKDNLELQFKLNADDNAQTTVLLASTHVAQQFEAAMGLEPNSLFNQKTEVDEVPPVIKELYLTKVRSPIVVKFTHKGSQNQKNYSKLVKSPLEKLDFTPENIAWCNPTAFLATYVSDLPDIDKIKADFLQEVITLTTNKQDLLADPFKLFILCLPFQIIFETYAYTNYSLKKSGNSQKVTFKDIIFIFIFQMERWGLSNIFGCISEPTQRKKLIISNSLYKSKFSTLKYNKFASILAESETPEQMKTVLSNSADHFANLFSIHSSKLVNNVHIAVIDEVSLAWDGKEDSFRSPPHITKNPSKVHQVAFELKCLNESTAGLRLGMLCVLARELDQLQKNDVEDSDIENMPKAQWQVMKLLQLCDLLGLGRKRPWLVIADAAFASMSLATHLRSQYGIHFLGPIKRNSSGSLYNIVKRLAFADQEMFVTQSYLQDTPESKPVKVFQAIDGTQNLVFTFNKMEMHHHASTRALRELKKNNYNVKGVGFHCLSPRYVYRINFNHCDKFNRCISYIGCTRNIFLDFSDKLMSFIVDSAGVNAKYLFCHFGRNNITTVKFSQLIVDNTYKYFDIKRYEDNNNESEGRNYMEKLQKLLIVMKQYCDKSVREYRHMSPGKGKALHTVVRCNHCPDATKSLADVACKLCSITKKDQIFCHICWNNHCWNNHQDLIN